MAFLARYLPFCFFLFIHLSLPINAQTHKNVSLGSSLAAQNDNSAWTSPSGDFAFGFQQINNGGFLLAIWFNKIPERTIVWSANGNNLVPSGSKLQLTANGQLVLDDPSENSVWTASPVGTGVSYAALLDTGNFVLANQDSVYLWESFDHPTDTILPAQTLSQGNQLEARYSNTNYLRGRFKFMLQSDGNFVLYAKRYPLDTAYASYWSSYTFNTSVDMGFQLIYNQSSGYIYLFAMSNESLLFQVFSNQISERDFYHRAVLDYDGVFRQYVYPKSSGSVSRWPVAWTSLSFTPPNICLAIVADTGSGACGHNSYCKFNDERNGAPSCQCPPGYVFLDPNDVNKGCKQNFVPQICDEKSEEADLFELIDMPNTSWGSSEYDFFDSVSEDWCRQDCLEDCHCAVAVYDIVQNCKKKRIPFSIGRTDSSIGAKALVKVRRNNATLHGSKKKDQSTLILAGSMALGSLVFFNVLLLTTSMYLFRRSHRKAKVDHPYRGMAAMSPRCYTYSELEAATGGFKEEVGSGSFGIVYKGVLENTQLVAVKKLHKSLAEEGEREFETEVSSIGATNHKNLVKLLGFCNEGQHRLLVYAYMTNGCLANFVFANARPNWHKRMQIASQVATGLSYLHEDCNVQIIHCDIKPQNILLDESLTARISDLGLAKLLKADQTRTTTAIRGTKGYVAPEWFKNMPITAKVDTYSFGILLLELVCCRRNLKMDANDEKRAVLADWAYDCYADGKLHLLVEDDEEALREMKKVEKSVMIALWCIQEDPSLRPAMKKVIHMLEGAAQVPVPPDPNPFSSFN